jgi:competence protein ComEC
MGLLTGFIFAVIRYGFALIPWVALRWPTKKIAAVCALFVGAFYLTLSGGNVATERAFIMVAVMFVAILLNRRALTLRAVAIAAVIVLVWQPEALIGPGFQMSFAATTALVAIFGGLRRFDLSRLPKWARPILSVILSSFIAGMATAPFAAAHFNQVAHYGLIANLLSVPLMGVLVMPAAVLAVCLAPFGLWEVGLWVMEKGLRWILFVAQMVATRDGALSHVWAPDPRVLPIMALGLIWVILVKGRIQFLGIFAVATAFAVWGQTVRPLLLVADSGGLLGLQTSAGRVLSKPRGDSFVAGIWMENDGWPVSQDIAAGRAGIASDQRTSRVQIGEWDILQVRGKTALAALQECGGADVLVTNQIVEDTRACAVYDILRLRQTGALAMDVNVEGDLVITSAHQIAGNRPWNARMGEQGTSVILALSERNRAAAATLASTLVENQ